jgi:DNA-3-methyladenine glycosylase II
MHKDTIYRHLRNDKVLDRLITVHGYLTELPLANSIYEELVSSIISQQLSVKAAATIYARFRDELEGDISPDQIIAADHERLRTLGLSNQKAKYIKEVAQYWKLNPTIEEDIWSMTDEDIIKELSAIKGVGVWTVQMLLIFALNRPNVLPLGDLIVRKGIIKHYGLDESDKDIIKKCQEIVSHWHPYATYGSRYMWASKDEIILSKK